MKLYLYAETERAKKTQGGNKTARVQLNYGSRDDSRVGLVVTANVREASSGAEVVELEVWNEDGERVYTNTLPLTPGASEACERCGRDTEQGRSCTFCGY